MWVTGSAGPLYLNGKFNEMDVFKCVTMRTIPYLYVLAHFFGIDSANTRRLSISRHSWTFVSCTKVPCTHILCMNVPSVFSWWGFAQQSIPRFSVLGIYNLYATIYVAKNVRNYCAGINCSQVLNTYFQKNLLEDASLYLPVCHVFCIILVSSGGGGGGRGKDKWCPTLTDTNTP